jgi:hypothetical protein
MIRPLLATLAVGFAAPAPPHPACCYFSAMDKDVMQPGQKALLTWDPVEGIESFTVQPAFEGNAEDFGMVVPTPGQPKLQEAPRDLFKALAIYTILKPMNVAKFTGFMQVKRAGPSGPTTGGGGPMAESKTKVTVLEAGVVGSLDYKIIEASDADGLFEWLKANKYTYSGDQKTLDFYIQKKWFFTVMKIDPKQMRRGQDGRYLGEVTPTRFTFASSKLVYPLRITKISVRDTTDVLLYIQAPEKMDFPGELTFQRSFQAMWATAYHWADWSLCNDGEKAWWEVVKNDGPKLNQELAEWQQRNLGRVASTLEWARKLTGADLDMLTGVREFDRKVPAEEVKKLALLGGILRSGQFITKCRHVFRKDEMDEDLVFTPAMFRGKKDGVEHIEILPTSPP